MSLDKRTVSVEGYDIELMVQRFNFKPNNNRLGFRVSDNIRMAKKAAQELFDAREKLEKFDKENKEFKKEIDSIMSQAQRQDGTIDEMFFNELEQKLSEKHPELAEGRMEIIMEIKKFHEKKYTFEAAILDLPWIKKLPVSAAAPLRWMLPEEIYLSELPDGLELKAITLIEEFCHILEDEPKMKVVGSNRQRNPKQAKAK